MGLISVIVPIYNAAEYVGACIESLMRQSCKDIEIILVNDGSADSSLEVINEYAKKDNRIIAVDKPNGGVSSARNAGIEKSSGEYIVFVDSDDYVDDDFIAQLKEYSDEGMLTLCGYIDLSFKASTIVYRSDEPVSRLDADGFVPLYLKWLINSPCNKLYRADIIKNNGILFKRGLSLGEDLLFNLEYIKYVSGFTVINKPLYHYCHPNAQSLTSSYTTDICTLRNELYKTILLYCKNDYGIEDSKLTKIYEIYEDELLGALDYVLASKELSLRARRATVKSIIDGNDFKSLIKRLSDAEAIHPLLYFLLSRGMYGTYKFLVNLKKKFNSAV